LETLALACSEAAEEVWLTGETATGEGVQAAGYGRRQPAWTRRLSARGADVVFVTALGCRVELRADAVSVDGAAVPL
jgi:hypothetical protein